MLHRVDTDKTERFKITKENSIYKLDESAREQINCDTPLAADPVYINFFKPILSMTI